MDRYPTLDNLLAGMQSRVNTTENWDVVVSYSVDKLNILLRKLWRANPAKTTSFNLKSEGEDFNGNLYFIDWELTLGAPQLEFLLDGQAKLSIPLSGRYQTNGSNNWKEIIANKYIFIAVVPLAWVSARSDTSMTHKGGPSSVIGFHDDPNATLYIVFDFKTTNVGGGYSIQQNPNYPNPEGGRSGVPDSFSISLREKLAAWIGDPANMSSIQYALASVKSTEVPGQAYLTPEQVAFTVYTNHEKTGVGCLSLYIKTKDSGYPAGNTYRSFRLPATQYANTYPIPLGYTASIIIRHDVFQKKFLEEPFSEFRTGEMKQFNSVVPTNTNTSGFELDLALNSKAVMSEVGKDDYFATKIEAIHWDLSKNPFRLAIDVKGNISYSYSFKDSVRWKENAFKGLSPFGRAEQELNVSKSTTFVTEASGEGVSATISLANTDWKRTLTAVIPDFSERYAGMVESLPSAVSNALNKLNLPVWRHSAKLDYFATTNIFAPGKKFINVSGQKNVFLPYDVLICGNVDEGVQGQSVDTASLHTMFRSLNATEFDELDVTSASTDDNTTDDTERFVEDMFLQKPVLRAAITAISTGDEKVVEAFVNNSGYKINHNTLDKIWTAATATGSLTSDNLTTADAENGSGFDIRFVAGLYTFVAPSPNDLLAAGKNIITIDASTARLSIDNDYVNNVTTSTGSVTFTHDKHNYEITFSTPYDSDGSIGLTTFTGTRSSTASLTAVTVTGKQVLPSPPVLSSNAALWISMISTVGGFLITLTLFCIHEPRKMKEGSEKISDCYNFVKDAAKDLGPNSEVPGMESGPKFDIGDLQDVIELEVKKKVESMLSDSKIPRKQFKTKSLEAVISLVERRAEEWVVQDAMMERLEKVLPQELYSDVLRVRVNKLTAEHIARFLANTSYVEALIDFQEAVHERGVAEEFIVGKENLAAEIRELELNKASLEGEIASKTADQVKFKDEIVHLKFRIAGLETDLADKRKQERTKDKDINRAKEAVNDLKKVEDLAKERFKKEGRGIFEPRVIHII